MTLQEYKEKLGLKHKMWKLYSFHILQTVKQQVTFVHLDFIQLYFF